MKEIDLTERVERIREERRTQAELRQREIDHVASQRELVSYLGLPVMPDASDASLWHSIELYMEGSSATFPGVDTDFTQVVTRFAKWSQSIRKRASIAVIKQIEPPTTGYRQGFFRSAPVETSPAVIERIDCWPLAARISRTYTVENGSYFWGDYIHETPSQATASLAICAAIREERETGVYLHTESPKAKWDLNGVGKTDINRFIGFDYENRGVLANLSQIVTPDAILDYAATIAVDHNLDISGF